MVRTPRCAPELWFRPCSSVPLQALLELFARRNVTATLRLGARNEAHEKGYVKGETAVVRVLDDAGEELLRTAVRIETICVKTLCEVSAGDLHGMHLYATWQDARRELALFERRAVHDDEEVSIIRFSYL